MKPEALPGLHMLQENLGLKGVNKLLNSMYNLVQQQNSHAFEERIQRLEERLYNTYMWVNTVQEVVSMRTHTAISEENSTKKGEAPN